MGHLTPAPLEGSLPTAITAPGQPTGICQQLARWELGREQEKGDLVQADADQLLDGANISAAAARQLNGEIRAALDNPPPGAARFIYTKAMVSYGAAETDIQVGDSAAGYDAIANAGSQVLKADTLLAQMGSKCTPPPP